MFVHFGRKTVREKLGRVASYCLICHSRNPFKVEYISKVWHISNVPIFREAVGHERVCELCGQEYATAPDQFRGFMKKKRVDLEELIAITNPGLEGGLETELALWDELLKDLPELTIRQRLISGPFHLLNIQMRVRRNKIRFDRWSVVTLISMFVSLFIVREILAGDPNCSLVVRFVFWLHMLALVAALFTANSRFFNRKLRPRLVRALAPLDVKEEELEDLVSRDPVAAQLSKWIPPHQLYQLLISQTQDQSPLGKI
jgi:hypothetical protein